MNILYMSCHEILEYDELKLFTEMGHKVFSLGAYTQPGGEEHRKRPALDLPYNPHFIELSMQYDRRRLHPEMLEGIDMVIVMHEPTFLGFKSINHDELGEGNWPLFREFIKKGGRVVWRSIGQSIPYVEDYLRPYREEGLEVVRYSPAESSIANNMGVDALIPFYKDPKEFGPYTGDKARVINFTQSLKSRGEFTGYSVMRKALDGLPFTVYGPGNDDLGYGLNGGLLSYETQKEALRQNRVYFYTGTYPASYTLSFIEAMMSGIPMVCVGQRLGNGGMFPDQMTYAIPQIIHNEKNGYYSDDIRDLRVYVEMLLANQPLAKEVGYWGRQRAIELFGKDVVKQLWANFFATKPKPAYHY